MRIQRSLGLGFVYVLFYLHFYYSYVHFERDLFYVISIVVLLILFIKKNKNN